METDKKMDGPKNRLKFCLFIIRYRYVTLTYDLC